MSCASALCYSGHMFCRPPQRTFLRTAYCVNVCLCVRFIACIYSTSRKPRVACAVDVRMRILAQASHALKMKIRHTATPVHARFIEPHCLLASCAVGPLLRRCRCRCRCRSRRRRRRRSVRVVRHIYKTRHETFAFNIQTSLSRGRRDSGSVTAATATCILRCVCLTCEGPPQRLRTRMRFCEHARVRKNIKQK